MDRIGKAGKKKKNEIICSECRIETFNETVKFMYQGKETRQRFEFRVPAAEGVKSSANQPKTVTPVTSD